MPSIYLSTILVEYALKLFRATRGSSLPLTTFEVGRFTRKKLAQGEAKALRNSTGENLVQHFPDCTINYFEYDDYYVFLVEDEQGLKHEVHVFLAEI